MPNKLDVLSMWIKNDRIARFMLPLGAVNAVFQAFQQAMEGRWWWVAGSLAAAVLFAYFAIRFITAHKKAAS